MLSFLKGYTSGINAKYSIGQEEFRVGPWAVHDGKQRSNGEPVSVFVFDKSALLKQLPQGVRKSVATQTVTDYAQRGVAQLSKLRHPSFVRLVEPLETSSKSMLFVTERLTSSLEALIVAKRNESVGSDELNDLAIERGALVLCEGLRFLHDLGQAHTNLSPSSVLVAASGDWKISGLEFVNEFSTDFFLPSIDPRMPDYLRVDLDFLAPEVVLDHTLGGENDVWALGCILYSAYTLRAPLDCRGDPNSWKDEHTKFSRKLKTMPPLAPRLSQQIAQGLFERSPSARLSLADFEQTDYFNHSLVKALQFLDSFETCSDSDKTEFLKYLEEILPQFPKPVLRRKILAFVVKELASPTGAGEAASTFQLSKILLSVSSSLSQLTFADEIIPLFKALQKNSQFHVALVDNIQVVVDSTTEKTFAKEVLPILQIILKRSEPSVPSKATSGDTPAPAATTQRNLLLNSASFVPHLSLSTLEQKLFPLVLALFGATQAKSVKVACIGSFRVMITNKLGSMLINEQLLPALRNMKTRDPVVVVAVKDLYNGMSATLSSAVVMEKVLPHLAEISLSRELSVGQLKGILDSMRAQISQFEQDQVKVLQTNNKHEIRDTFDREEIGKSASVVTSAWSGSGASTSASAKSAPTWSRPTAKPAKQSNDLMDFDEPSWSKPAAPAPKPVTVTAPAPILAPVAPTPKAMSPTPLSPKPLSPSLTSPASPQNEYSSPFLVSSLPVRPAQPQRGGMAPLAPTQPSQSQAPAFTLLQPTKKTDSLL